MKNLALVILLFALISGTALSKVSSHAANPVARLGGLLMESDDGFYAPGKNPVLVRVNEAMKQHQAKFGKSKAGGTKVLSDSWDPTTKQGKVSVLVKFEKGSDTVFLYYTEITGPMMTRASLHYLAFASQTQENVADQQLGPINKLWKNQVQL